jgi:hypothetical protein
MSRRFCVLSAYGISDSRKFFLLRVHPDHCFSLTDKGRTRNSGNGVRESIRWVQLLLSARVHSNRKDGHGPQPRPGNHAPITQSSDVRDRAATDEDGRATIARRRESSQILRQEPRDSLDARGTCARPHSAMRSWRDAAQSNRFPLGKISRQLASRFRQRIARRTNKRDNKEFSLVSTEETTTEQPRAQAMAMRAGSRKTAKTAKTAKKAAAKSTARKTTAKSSGRKAAAKSTTRKTTAKATAKTAGRKTGAKTAGRKAAAKTTGRKAAAKTTARKTTAKSTAKSTAKATGRKAAAKTTGRKAVAKTVSRKTVAAKTPKKAAAKSGRKAMARKVVAKRPRKVAVAAPPIIEMPNEEMPNTEE